MDTTKIKEKLKKLLALSECDGAAAGEIQNAIDAATRLMAAHNLTRDDIDWTDSTDASTSKVSLGRHTAVSNGAKLTTWELWVINFCTKFVGYCESYTERSADLKLGGVILRDSKGNVRKGAMIHFYGSDDSAAAAKELFEELRDVIATMAIARYNSWARGDGAAYAEGFGQGLVSQLRSSMQRMDDSDSQTHALMLRDRQNQIAIRDRSKDWLAKTHGVRLGKGSARSGSRSGSHEAREQGRKDGSSYSASTSERKRRIA